MEMGMKMTAMESLMDPHMIYLDLAAGIGGLVLYNMIGGPFKLSNVDWKLAGVVLLSRLLIDFGYSKLVSEKDFFGGSNQEFILSSLMWFSIMFFIMKTKNTTSLYLSTVLVMFAVARATHWG